jgi:sigma-B regulation protein RsbU (phosphoserine phosphatase)
MALKDRPTVLYVDADEYKTEHFKRAFRSTYRTLTAEGPADALTHISEHEATLPVQVVVADDKLSKGSGLEFLAGLKASHPKIVRVIVAPPQRNKAVLAAIDEGQLSYSIVKPWDLDELQLAIESALRIYRNDREREAIESHLEQLVAARTEQLEAKTHSLEHAMEQIHDSITYARKIQYALLPEVSAIRKALPKSFIFYQPRDIVSGDFYWFYGRRKQCMLAVVDCTGHGVPSAFMSILGMNNLNQIIREHGLINPGAVLSELNDRICAMLKQGFVASNDAVPPLDGMDLGLCLIEPENGKVTFAGACRPIVYTQGGEVKYIKGSIRPIGGTSLLDSQSFDSHELQLSPGDRIFLYTDGITDQFGGLKRRKLTSTKWIEFLTLIAKAPFDDMHPRIEAFYREWRGTWPQTDDLLVMGVEL